VCSRAVGFVIDNLSAELRGVSQHPRASAVQTRTAVKIAMHARVGVSQQAAVLDKLVYMTLVDERKGIGDLEQPNPGRGAAPGQHVSHPDGPKRPGGELN